MVQVKMARHPPFLVPNSDGNRSPRLPNGSIQDLTQLFERPNEGRNQESILEIEYTVTKSKFNKTLRSVHFGVVVVELIKCKCGGIVKK